VYDSCARARARALSLSLSLPPPFSFSAIHAARLSSLLQSDLQVRGERGTWKDGDRGGGGRGGGRFIQSKHQTMNERESERGRDECVLVHVCMRMHACVHVSVQAHVYLRRGGSLGCGRHGRPAYDMILGVPAAWGQSEHAAASRLLTELSPARARREGVMQRELKEGRGRVRNLGRESIELQGIIIAFNVVEIGSTRTEERKKPVFEVWYNTSRHDCLL
jgi:hypothetical protein